MEPRTLRIAEWSAAIRSGPMYSRTPSMRSPTKQVGKVSGSSLTSLGRDIQTQIGVQLRVVHEDIVKQGIPDRFAHLLFELDRAPKGDHH